MASLKTGIRMDLLMAHQKKLLKALQLVLFLDLLVLLESQLCPDHHLKLFHNVSTDLPLSHLHNLLPSNSLHSNYRPCRTKELLAHSRLVVLNSFHNQELLFLNNSYLTQDLPKEPSLPNFYPNLELPNSFPGHSSCHNNQVLPSLLPKVVSLHNSSHKDSSLCPSSLLLSNLLQDLPVLSQHQ